MAIENVTVLPMGGREPLAGYTVVVSGDRISAVGLTQTVSVPDDAVRVDATCRFLIPGLTDMHTHVNFVEEMLLYVANGVTSIREMWGSPARLDLARRIRSGAFAGPAPSIISASRGIDGDPPVFPGAPWATNDPAVAAGWVEEAAAAGHDFVKVYERLRPDVYDAIIARAAEIGIPVAGHVPHGIGAAAVIASDQVSIEHLDDFYQLMAPVGESPVWWQGPIDQGRFPDVAREIATDAVWNVPTLNVVVAIRTAAERDHFDRTTPELRFLPDAYLEFWDGQDSGQDPAVRDAALSNMTAFLAHLAGAGANIMVGTDAGFNRIVPGFAMVDELELMAASGIGNAELLEMATARPARFLGQSSEVGRVAAGLRADLVLLDGDPRESFDVLRTPAGVVVRGEWWSGARLRTLLEEQAAMLDAEPSRFRLAGPAGR